MKKYLTINPYYKLCLIVLVRILILFLMFQFASFFITQASFLLNALAIFLYVTFGYSVVVYILKTYKNIYELMNTIE